MTGKRQCTHVVWINNCALEFTAAQRFLLEPTSWYGTDERREITEGYRGYMPFDIAFLSWVKVLLDLLSLSNFLSQEPVLKKMKFICFLFQTVKND